MLRQGSLLTSLLLLMRSVCGFSVSDSLQLPNHPEQPPGRQPFLNPVTSGLSVIYARNRALLLRIEELPDFSKRFLTDALGNPLK
jgi:hypothetical protein